MDVAVLSYTTNAGMARKRVHTLRTNLEERIAGLEATDPKIAVGGIRIEALGLFLVLAGLAAQSLGHWAT